MFALLASTVVLALGPYAGPPLSGSIPRTAKFAVHVDGSPGSSVRLRAIDVPHGYVASFCTDRVCAPYRVTLRLPARGEQTIELQVIANAEARPPVNVVVEANGTLRRSISYARATH